MPIWIGEVDLEAPEQVSPIGGWHSGPYGGGRLLVRLRHLPLRLVQTEISDPTSLDARAVLGLAGVDSPERIAEFLGNGGRSLGLSGVPESITSQLRDQGADTWREPITVVVCTRNRPEHVATCIASLKDLDYPEFEVLIVDNAPADRATEDVFEELVGSEARFKYLVEPRPGLCIARNHAVEKATHRYITFTDDDVRVDRWWLQGIARGFGRHPDVACVTGLVASGRLETQSEVFFDKRVGWSSSLEPRLYGLNRFAGSSPLYPYSAGTFGTGANVAVDREVFDSIGGFDVALGPGAPAHAGEDLDLFVRVIALDRIIAYEPSAITWHFHRATQRDLAKQMFNYGCGLSAFLTKLTIERATRWKILRQAVRGVVHMLRIWRKASGGDEASGKGTWRDRSIVLHEVRGLLSGPALYLLGRRRARALEL